VLCSLLAPSLSIIWLIIFEVIVMVVWNMLLKDVLGFFPGSNSD
jgi:hypothetical protein